MIAAVLAAVIDEHFTDYWSPVCTRYQRAIDGKSCNPICSRHRHLIDTNAHHSRVVQHLLRSTECNRVRVQSSSMIDQHSLSQFTSEYLRHQVCVFSISHRRHTPSQPRHGHALNNQFILELLSCWLVTHLARYYSYFMYAFVVITTFPRIIPTNARGIVSWMARSARRWWMDDLNAWPPHLILFVFIGRLHVGLHVDLM